MRVYIQPLTVLAFVFVAARIATPQTYSISARPGGINFVQGKVTVNSRPVGQALVGKLFLNSGDTLATVAGKVEVVLTPGFFLRVGDNSSVHMLSVSMVDVRFEVLQGEVIADIDELVQENNVNIQEHNAAITIKKPGLYRITAGQPASVAVIAGKIEIQLGNSKLEVSKGKEVEIADTLVKRKLDLQQTDDLYAWSNIRSEYDSGASLQTAQRAYNASLAPDLSGADFAPGWFWNDMFDSWAWLPGGDLGFFSPFGYGFFGPGSVQYAPICGGPTKGGRPGVWHGVGTFMPVIVNPRNPPTARPTQSIAQNRVARSSVAHSFAGFRTLGGSLIPTGSRITTSSSRGSRSAFGNSGSHVWAGSGGHVTASSVSSAGRGFSGGGGGAGGGGHFGGGSSSAGGGHAGGGGGGASGGGGGHR